MNDHNQLRKNLLIQISVVSNKNLTRASTLSRFERKIDKKTMVAIHNLLIENFINSYKKAPKEIILDFDGSDDKVHGNQLGGMFHGYYKHKWFLPLYVFCNNHLLVAYLRPGNVHDSKHSWAILKLLVKKIRIYWPKVGIIFKRDSAFCRHRMFNWCERKNVKYITEISSNNRLINHAKSYVDRTEYLFNNSGEEQKKFGEIKYAAKSWKKERKLL